MKASPHKLKWALLALALALSLVAVTAAALDFGAAQPDPAEAQGRGYSRDWLRMMNASHPVADDELYPVHHQMGPCTVELTGADRARSRELGARTGGRGDTLCISHTDTALVTLALDSGDTAANPTRAPGTAARSYRAYVTGGRSGMGEAFHPGVQATDGGLDHNGQPLNAAWLEYLDGRTSTLMGQPGLAEYNGRLTGSATRRIEVTRDMATTGCAYPGWIDYSRINCSVAYVFIYTGADNGALSDLPQKVTNGSLADLSPSGVAEPDMMVRIYFVQEFDIGQTWLFFPGVRYGYDEEDSVDDAVIPHDWRGGTVKNPVSLGAIQASGNYNPLPGNAFKPAVDRELNLTGRWQAEYNRWQRNKGGVVLGVMPRDYHSASYYHRKGKTTVRLDFAPGTNYLDPDRAETETTWTTWGSEARTRQTRQLGANGYWEATQESYPNILRGSFWDAYFDLDGWDPEGPMRGQLTITYEDGKGGTHRMQPFTVYVKGPPTSLNIMETSVRSSNDGSRSVRVRFEVTDAMGHVLESDDHLQTAVVDYDDITHAGNGRLKATGNLASATWRAANAATRSAIGGSGSGRDGLLVIPVKADAPAGTYTVNITASANRQLKGSVSFEVPAAREPAPRPGQPAPPAQPATVSVAVAASSDLTAGGRAEFTYALSDASGNPLPASAHPVTWSAADAATTAIIDAAGSVDPARQTDGAFGFDLADNAAPGAYRVTVATAAADNAASGSVSFTIRGGPAAYAITGPDTVPPGGYAVYQVTVTDANGATPILTAEQRAVTIAVSGAGAGNARLFNLSSGNSLALDAAGVGHFRLRASLAAAQGSVITIAATGVAGATAGSKSVRVETAATTQ